MGAARYIGAAPAAIASVALWMARPNGGEGRVVFGQKVELTKAASGVSPPTTLVGALFDW